jgi:hypothetical protein
MQPEPSLLTALSRRSFFRRAGSGFGAVALTDLLRRDLAGARQQPFSHPHFAPKAKRVIYLHMIGAPSQLDMWDNKPGLKRWHGKACPESLLKGRRFAMIDGGKMSLIASPYAFERYGQAGTEISELLPHMRSVADEIAVCKTLHTDEINHAPAQMLLHSGFGRGGRPSLGSWLSYGLGAGNDNLPAFVCLLTGAMGGAGTSLWSNGFLPSVHQGIRFRSEGDAVLFLSNPKGQSGADRRRIFDAVKSLNQTALADVGDPEIATRISQYEMAYRMQTSVPELMDISKEPRSILELYGARPGRATFANNCLLARRLIERGVRVVELYDADWDHHGGLLTRLPAKCRDIDQGMAALIHDLKQRGLLDETLVVWGSEFGRTPLRQGGGETGGKSVGRDHHKDAYTMWLAGGGIRGGQTYGETSELGFDPVDKPLHVHDLNATLLHLLGLDHERLTFKYQGRDYRLTDIHGHVAEGLIA